MTHRSLRARLLGSPDYVHETRCPSKEKRHASKRAFLSNVRKLLGLTAPASDNRRLALQPGEARVFSMMGGPAVGGEVRLQTSTWFVMLSAREGFNFGRLENDQRPYNMGRNCEIPASCLATPEGLADWIRRQGWPLP